MSQINSTWQEIETSLELNKAAVHQLDFLRTVYEMPPLFQQSIIDAAMYRYRQMWLPLAAEYHGTILAAPLDIEWVWHCHMLSPRDYHEDCLHNFNKIINHKLMSSAERKRILPIAEKYWNKKYPHQPFEICFPSGKVLSCSLRQLRGAHQEVILAYDLEAAIQRQRSFCYQVSLPHFRDKTFLQSALKRYQKSLFLKRQYPQTHVIPFHDVALLLQTHQVHPSQYQTDMQTIFGNSFLLDDDFSDPFQFRQQDHEVTDLWDNTFHEPMPRAGTMFRGKPTFNFMSVLRQEDIRSALGKRVKLTSIEARVREAPDAQRKRLELWTFSNDGVIGSKPIILECTYANYLWQTKDSEDLDFDTSIHRGLRLHMLTKPGLFQRDVTLGKGTCDILDEVTSDAHPGNPITKSITMQGKKQFQANVTFKKLDVEKIELELELHTGQFESLPMSLFLGHLWNSIFTDPTLADREAECLTAKHILTLTSGAPLFTSRVVQCPELMMAAVQLLFKEEMVVLAHLIGHDQLPRKQQVKIADYCPTLEPQNAERREIAFVIKNKYGDWAVCVGVIEDGLQRNKDAPVTIRVYKIKTHTSITVTLPRFLDRETEIVVDGIRIDVPSGAFHVSGSLDELAEKIVLVFVVFQIHVMAIKEENLSSEGLPGKCVSQKNPFSIATGAMVDTPRQHYWTDYFNESIFSSQTDAEELASELTPVVNSRQSRAARMATFMRSDTVESEGDCLESFFLHVNEDEPPSYAELMGNNRPSSTPDDAPPYTDISISAPGSAHGSQTWTPDNMAGDCLHPPAYETLADLQQGLGGSPSTSAVYDWVCALPSPGSGGHTVGESGTPSGDFDKRSPTIRQ